MHYRDHHSSWIASQVAVSSGNYTLESSWQLRNHWSEDYNIHLFGSDAAFEYRQLFHSPIEKRALELHKSYHNAMYTTNHAAEGDFFRRSYNRDSSIAACIGILYQCFGMGIYHPDPNTYLTDCHKSLGERYYSLLRQPPVDDPDYGVNSAALNKAAEIEHARWRCFCASRGWSAPDDATMLSYLRNGSPKHHLEIGLLHPYMASYSNLPNIRNRINHLIEENNLETDSLSDPCAPDKIFVLNTPVLLGYIPAEDLHNKSHP